MGCPDITLFGLEATNGLSGYNTYWVGYSTNRLSGYNTYWVGGYKWVVRI